MADFMMVVGFSRNKQAGAADESAAVYAVVSKPKPAAKVRNINHALILMSDPQCQIRFMTDLILCLQ